MRKTAAIQQEKRRSDYFVGYFENRKRANILAIFLTNFHDIEIGEYSISWNLNGGDDFAISEESVHEAGCIHTSQGLEFDYTGVIIGDDMRFENGKVICTPVVPLFYTGS